MEPSDRRKERVNTAVESGAGVERNLGRRDGRIGIDLIIKESAHEFEKPWLVNVGTKQNSILREGTL
jgi:hypothetical protein